LTRIFLFLEEERDRSWNKVLWAPDWVNGGEGFVVIGGIFGRGGDLLGECILKS
jgi:hypothetical protein